jgi:hypothetical protein
VIRRDYDEAGCAGGCRDTLATGVLFGLLLLALVWRGRRRG